MFIFSGHSVLLWVIGILIISFDLVVYLGSKSLSSRTFASFSLPVAIWSISYGFLISATNSDTSLLLIKINHILGIISSLGFLYFSFIYPSDTNINRFFISILVIVGLIIGCLIFFSDLFITGMFEIPKPDHWGWKIGKLYFIYNVLFYLLWSVILLNLWRKIKLSVSEYEKKNLIYMFWGLTLGIIPPAILNILLPTFGKYGISWLGPISSSIWVYIIGYSIIRYRQMNVKVVITEVLAIAMTVIFFINIFTKTTLFGAWDNIITFFVFLFLAIFLIRVVLSEVRQKEKLRIINENLESIVEKQTLEVRKSYELEKKAKRDLEKLNETKDQFILITQHHLRTPISIIKSKIDSISINLTDTVVKDTVKDINFHLNKLIKIVNDFLGITTIKPGSNILNLSYSNLKTIIEDIIDELKIDIEQKKITFSYSKNNADWPNIRIDQSKMRDALLIIIENSIKYNTDHGRVDIKTILLDKIFQIDIIDNGIGIIFEDKEKIMNDIFIRGEQAKIINPTGMGVGLSVAKAIIKAHHGEIDIQSPNKNNGTTVSIKIPVDYLADLNKTYKALQ